MQPIVNILPSDTAYIVFIPADVLARMEPYLQQQDLVFTELKNIPDAYCFAMNNYAEKYRACGYQGKSELKTIKIRVLPQDIFRASLPFLNPEKAMKQQIPKADNTNHNFPYIQKPKTVTGLKKEQVHALKNSEDYRKYLEHEKARKNIVRQKSHSPLFETKKHTPLSKQRDFRKQQVDGSSLFQNRKHHFPYAAAGAASVALCTVFIAGVCVSHASAPKEHPSILSLDTAVKDTMTPALQKDAFPEVNNLVTAYYASQAQGNADEYAATVDSASEEDRAKVIRSESLFEEYQHISCYTLPGVEDGAYYVFVYYDLKFSDIDTPAPGLTLLYVYPDSDGNLKILNQDASAEILVGAELASANEEVIRLSEETKEKYEQAKASDENLAALEEKYLEMIG